MRVQSPVGTFPMRLGRPRLAGGRPRIPAAMGAWHSEVTLDRDDVPLILYVAAFATAVFLLGRSTAPKP